MAFSSLWILFTLLAAGAQTLRNAMQRSLVETLGTVGATHVRFLFGLPFALVFLAGVILIGREPLPVFHRATVLWVLEGAATQIIATALMLAAMRDRSFVVTIAYTKTEPVQVAIFGLAVLGDHLSGLTITAIVVATAGVMLMSWPRSGATERRDWRPAALGLLSGAFFALSAIGFRAAILDVGGTTFVVAATSVLACGLVMQAASLSLYLWLFDRRTLVAIVASWRPSLFAGLMGAIASQFWFLAFALTTAAKVRTLGLIEVLFAQLVSRRMLKEGADARELTGIGLILVGIVLLVNG
jgi:drug/metabolite transporter (DMT)-like permease